VKKRAVVAGLCLLALTVSGCTRTEKLPDQSPVPTQASAPFACDGVPLKATELILGGEVVLDRAEGGWDDKVRGLSCAVTAKGSKALVMVTMTPMGQSPVWGSNEQEVLQTLAAQPNATPIEAEGEGAGYLSGGGNAGWVCGDRFILVEISAVHAKGRDKRADAQALLVSMLPWACNGEPVPKQSVQN